MTHLISYYPDISLLSMVETKKELNPILLQQFDINLRDAQGRNALYRAIANQSEHNVRLLLQHNISLHVTPRLHALFQAVTLESLTIVGYLLSQDININMRNPQGETPLIVAVQHKNLPMIRYLLRYGADTTASCYRNKSVADYARMTQNSEIQALFNR